MLSQIVILRFNIQQIPQNNTITMMRFIWISALFVYPHSTQKEKRNHSHHHKLLEEHGRKKRKDQKFIGCKTTKNCPLEKTNRSKKFPHVTLLQYPPLRARSPFKLEKQVTSHSHTAIALSFCKRNTMQFHHMIPIFQQDTTPVPVARDIIHFSLSYLNFY